ncbi:MAG: ComEC/Rec2 family competence protein, partial [Dehalococcoidia bacterium]
MPPLLLVGGGYVVGTLLGALLGGPWWQTALLGSLLGLAVLVDRPGARGGLLLLAAVAFASLGHARFEAEAARPPPPIATATGAHEVTGVVREAPRIAGSLLRLDLAIEMVDGVPAEGGLRLTLPAPPEAVHAGERLRFVGRIEPPPVIEDFDYAAFLRSQGIHAVSAYPTEWERLGLAEAGWREALRRLHRGAVGNIERALPEPEAALAAGVLVGERGTLPSDTVEELRVTGTTHLVVVSGQNIALLLGVAVAVLTAVLSRRRAALVALTLLVPYVVLVGGDPPVVRAAIMAVGITLASVTGRRTPGWVYLLQAVAVMLAVDPMLSLDVAFQLSATATAGVIVLAPALRDALFQRWPLLGEEWRAPAAAAAATATGAALAVAPVQAAAFERIAPWSIPANIVVAPLYEATFALAAFAALTGGIDPVADLIGTAGRVLPATFLGLVTIIARLPGADVPVTIPLGVGAAYYAVLAGGVAWLARRRDAAALTLEPGRGSRLGGTVALAAVAGGLWVIVLTAPSTLASVTVLDVGHGLAVLVQHEGDAVLIDTGPSDGAVLRALPVADATRALDLIVLTHGDADHAGGLTSVVRRLSVGGVVAGGDTLGSRRLADAAEIDIGDRVEVGSGVTVDVLGPPVEARPATLQSANDQSLVLMVTMGDRRVLLPADIEA